MKEVLSMLMDSRVNRDSGYESLAGILVRALHANGGCIHGIIQLSDHPFSCSYKLCLVGSLY